MTGTNRSTIFLEDARILEHHHWPDDQHILRLNAPECARQALPGQFVHLQCDRSLELRRPLSILRSNQQAGWIELLYKVVGHGTTLLAAQQEGESLSVLGPIGNTFTADPAHPHRILIGGGVGIPPMIYLAEHMASQQPERIEDTLVLMGSESPFPFDLGSSEISVSGIDNATRLCLSSLENLRIPSRLSSLSSLAGCHQGYITDLARSHLESLADPLLKQVELFACGPGAMLQAVKALAEEYNLPCKVSLEEYMACAVGGCAGCVVRIHTNEGDTMKRVCVDGPVFEAHSVIF